MKKLMSGVTVVLAVLVAAPAVGGCRKTTPRTAKQIRDDAGPVAGDYSRAVLDDEAGRSSEADDQMPPDRDPVSGKHWVNEGSRVVNERREQDEWTKKEFKVDDESDDTKEGLDD